LATYYVSWGLVSALTGASLTLSAAGPAFWEVANLNDFLRGELTGLAIDTEGRLTLGPTIRLTADTTSPIVWQLLPADDGSLLAGTGNDGKVFRIGPSGSMTSAFDSGELEVHALALAKDGAFYAGTSPDGKVYRVARDGDVKEVFDPEDKYIWALAAGNDDTLFVATGEKGVIYRVSEDGKATPFYRTHSTNVTSLAIDPKGNLIAGTSSPGQVLRIDPQGRGFVLLDSSYAEIRALRFDLRGNLYVVAVSGGQEGRPAERPAAPAPSAAPVPSVSTEITITAIGDVPTTAGPLPAGGSNRTESRRDSSRGAIFRIAPDGLWEPFWEATEDIPYDVVIERDGALLVATGPKGRLLRLSGDPVRITVVARAEAQQVTSLAQGRKGELHYATSNPGKVFELAQAFAPEGTYESDVRDATNVASWGLIRWRASMPDGASVRLSTRSGNTKTPDETWSPWSDAYTSPDGQAITSPKARYLQWRAVLTGKRTTPVLTSVTVAYLPRNSRPNIASITVHPPGVTFARPFPTGDPEIAGFENGTSEGRPQPINAPVAAGGPALGRRMYQKGLQTFVWKAEDEPGDKLQYDVSYRRLGETDWVQLRRDLWDAILTWDTTSVPDGSYTIKVVASDTASNAPGTALVAERESEAFDIDNTAPSVSVTSVRTVQGRTVVSFTVTDGHSPIERVEYSLDAIRWRIVYPVDGIPDSREERFEVTLDAGAAPPVMIRATDALNNFGSAEARPVGSR
jgi:hypothetical protein